MSAPSRVVIVGRDAPLWLAAGALSRGLGESGVEVIAVELPTRLSPAQVCATLPALEAFHVKLGVDEGAMIRATGGSFSLGYNIVDSGGRLPGFFTAWGAYGAAIDGAAFFPCWQKAAHAGLKLPFDAFSPTAVAAKNGRMLLPDESTDAFGRMDYGYHLPAMAYAGWLKAGVVADGVTAHAAQALRVERGEAGVAAVVADGERLAGDLFIDATGADAALMQALGVGWESWRGLFAADRVLSARAPAFKTTPPFAEVRLGAEGWTALYPTQAGTGVTHVFLGARQTDEAAQQAARVAAGAALADVRIADVAPGLRAAAWEGNCIAVGAAAFALDPIFAPELHMVQLGLAHLLALFPVAARFDAERAEYNRLTRSCAERVRDFQAAFYALAPEAGVFWTQARPLELPETLAHKIATFRARGAVAPMEDETFPPDHWRALLLGLGAAPESWAPAVDALAPERVRAHMNAMLDFIRSKVGAQPTHQAYLDAICGRGT